MTKITIRTIGNPALYRSLQESLFSETQHRTTSGASRRLAKIRRDSERWAQNMGHWGKIEIEIDGQTLDSFDTLYIVEGAADRAWSPSEVEREIENALRGSI